jgi:hypothetical protein
MTGILQNTNAERFFLTRYRPEFQTIFDMEKHSTYLVMRLSGR